jgi:hypothetical protein
VSPDSFYLYKIELEKGVTFKGKIIISSSEEPVTVEVYDPDGDIIDKISVLEDMDIEFVSKNAGLYDIRFHNHDSNSTIYVTFNFEVKRDVPVIPAFPLCPIFIGIGFFIISKTSLLRARKVRKSALECYLPITYFYSLASNNNSTTH